MSDRIRVLFAIGSLAGGGSERQVVNILRYIDRSRFEPFLYLVNRAGEFLNQVPDDVRIFSFTAPPQTGPITFPGQLRRTQIADLATHLREQQIDVLYDRTPNMTLIAAPACSRTRTPRLSTIVCDPKRDTRESFARFRWIKTTLLQKAYRTADRVIANSDSLAMASRIAYGLSSQRITTVSNGFDFDEISRLSEIPGDTTIHLPGRDTFHLVAVGRLHPQKGLDYLIDAVNKLRESRSTQKILLSIVGQGPELQRLQKRIDELSLDHQVRFTGFMENPYQIVRAANLFCLTSRYEGMPNVLVEAMSLGVPVLSTDCPYGPRDILQNGEFGTLIRSLDSQAIATGIEQEMNAGKSRDVQTTKAKESVLARFGIEQTTRELEDLLIRAAR